jgi:hypothetical protein
MYLLTDVLKEAGYEIVMRQVKALVDEGRNREEVMAILHEHIMPEFRAWFGKQAEHIALAMTNDAPSNLKTLSRRPSTIRFRGRRYGQVVLRSSACPLFKQEIFLGEGRGAKMFSRLRSRTGGAAQNL